MWLKALYKAETSLKNKLAASQRIKIRVKMCLKVIDDRKIKSLFRNIH